MVKRIYVLIAFLLGLVIGGLVLSARHAYVAVVERDQTWVAELRAGNTATYWHWASQTPATPDITLAFEQTAIAQFTAAPEFAPSMTPFYAEIIYNNTLRTQMHQPVPGPTHDPAVPTPACEVIDDFFVLSEFSDQVESTIAEHGLVTFVDIVTYRVWHVDGSCETAQPVFMEFLILLDVSAEDPLEPGRQTRIAFEALMAHLPAYAEWITPVASNMYSAIRSYTENELLIFTTWDIVLRAYNQGLPDDELVPAVRITPFRYR